MAIDEAGFPELHDLAHESAVGEELAGVQEPDALRGMLGQGFDAVEHVGPVLPLEDGGLGDQVLAERDVVAFVNLGQHL